MREPESNLLVITLSVAYIQNHVFKSHFQKPSPASRYRSAAHALYTEIHRNTCESIIGPSTYSINIIYCTTEIGRMLNWFSSIMIFFPSNYRLYCPYVSYSVYNTVFFFKQKIILRENELLVGLHDKQYLTALLWYLMIYNYFDIVLYL